MLSVLDETTKAAKSATAALRETEKLLGRSGDALDENRPALRRALADLREAGRNFKDMSSRLKRQPWLLLKKPKKVEQEVALLESATRSLSSAAEDLAVTVEYLEKISRDPASATRVAGAKAGDLIKEIRTLHKELDVRREDLQEKVKEMKRKRGGRYFKRAREKADREK